MENAVVYARYSSHNQTEQSIEGQLAAAKKTEEYHLYSGLLAKKQVSQKFKLTRERIELFLRQFVSGNIADVNCRKRIVSVLVNRIFSL